MGRRERRERRENEGRRGEGTAWRRGGKWEESKADKMGRAERVYIKLYKRYAREEQREFETTEEAEKTRRGYVLVGLQPAPYTLVS